MRKVVSHSTSAGSSDSASCANGNTQCLLGDRCLYCSGTLSAYSSGCLQASHKTFFQLKHPLGTFLACRPSTTVLISSALKSCERIHTCTAEKAAMHKELLCGAILPWLIEKMFSNVHPSNRVPIRI